VAIDREDGTSYYELDSRGYLVLTDCRILPHHIVVRTPGSNPRAIEPRTGIRSFMHLESFVTLTIPPTASIGAWTSRPDAAPPFKPTDDDLPWPPDTPRLASDLVCSKQSKR
jgi:hypothetical protein